MSDLNSTFKTPPPTPVAILMTATVTPAKGMIGSAINNPTERLLEYCQAFEFYLDIPDEFVNMIVILENSQTDLSAFSKIASERATTKTIHLINTSSDYPGAKGKGYGEFLMIDEGLGRLPEKDRLPSALFWKVTGRLKLLNLERLLKTAPSGYEVYCDLREAPFIGDLFGGNKWMELRVFSFTIVGYDRYLRGKYDLGLCLEAFFFDIMKVALSSGAPHRIFPRFKIQPIFDGFCGHNLKSYQGVEYRTKNIVRSIFRTVLPRVWL